MTLRALTVLLAALALASPVGAGSTRIWVDVDAACDGSAGNDVDDCLALLHIARVAPERVAAISTSFGNAALPLVRETTRQLAVRWRGESGTETPPIWDGAHEAGSCETDAARALAQRLREEQLEILVLGPATNVACALASHNVRANVVRVVAVMGASPGEIFHPAEDHRAKALLGHGPVFSDSNYAADPEAAAALLDMGVAVALVPYASARWLELLARDLPTLASSGPMASWIAERSLGWARFWRGVAGRDGFFPFDVVAALAVTRPTTVACSPAAARVGVDTRVGWLGPLGIGPRRLLIRPGVGASVCALRGTPPRLVASVTDLWPVDGGRR